jgi:hypothetical protein
LLKQLPAPREPNSLFRLPPRPPAQRRLGHRALSAQWLGAVAVLDAEAAIRASALVLPGARDFDPEQVGFRADPGGENSCETGETLFSMSDSNGKPVLGNSVMGHSFEGPPRDNHDYPKGIIGRGFSDEERKDLVEYLKTF